MCRCPSKNFLCFSRITEKSFYFCGSEIFRIDFYNCSTSIETESKLIKTFTSPFNIEAKVWCCGINKVLYGILLTSCNHIIIWLLLLKHQPHSFYVVFGVSPVTSGIEVSKLEITLESHTNSGQGSDDLAVTNVSPRRELSWLNRIPLVACMS